ncbi:C45 family autoproteolytic acyltransferase/hydolase [Vallitalea okinawensis]|uniref:C45 family autoproteolytic acyltransferase/hydolase n=1 Tax=Vallitalea okinawensis TaxID=2078660 RepID=UPI000CFD64E7|nr:C45 family peptidase [Vallitalea okinawensis]
MYKPRLQGDHYDMGYHYGSLLYKNGVRFDQLIEFDEERLDFGVKSLNISNETYPEINREIEGMAKGLKVDYESFGTFLVTAGAFSFDFGCSTFCYRKDSQIYFARNHDMFVQLKKTTESVLYRPDGGYYFIGQGDALIGKEDGVNEHGLAVGMTFVAPKLVKPGMNFLFMVRMVLEKCKTVEESIDLLQSLKTSTSHNVVLADREGDMAVVEMCPEKIIVRRPTKDADFIIATNHFQDSQMLKYDNRPDEDWYYTKTRYATIYESLINHKAYDLQLGMDILSGKEGFICQYKRSMNFDTLWSICVDLGQLDIYRSVGNPRKSKFKKETRLRWAMDKRDKI